MNITPKIRTYNDTVDLTFKVNDKVKVIENYFEEDGNKCSKVIFQGRIYSTNSSHFTIKNRNGNNESFMYAYILNGRYKVERLK